MKRALILFTKVPVSGIAKTRLFDFLTEEEAAKLQKKLLFKIYETLKGTEEKIFIFSTPLKHKKKLENILRGKYSHHSQKGSNIGEKMRNAIEEVYNLDYDRILLVGSDIVGLSSTIIEKAFEKLKNVDVVLGEADDGGYYLIGMNRPRDIFDIEKYSSKEVLKNTIENIEKQGLKYAILEEKLMDIDTKEDLIKYYLNTEKIEDIGSGEYNSNYKFYDKDGKEKVFRINFGSQMHLTNQIEYEYKALKILEGSGVTPKVYSFDNSKEVMPYGTLMMEYLEGRSLDYNKDVKTAAKLLSTLHSHDYPKKNSLIKVKKPFEAMYSEFKEMYSKYLNYSGRDDKVVLYIDSFMEHIYSLGTDSVAEKYSVINTELNSENFIIGENLKDSYIIDWEKPILGECEQDVAHFLAPTTTFWKTDTILTKSQIREFVTEYEVNRKLNIDKLNKYIIFTCLRGITWCSMAYVEYLENQNKLKDKYTFEKIKTYLSYDFLDRIDKNYIQKVSNDE